MIMTFKFQLDALNCKAVCVSYTMKPLLYSQLRLVPTVEVMRF